MGQGATRVAIYARVSTGEQSPELQVRELRDYADRRGFTVHREDVDQTSGDVRRRQRAPEFDALMADARRRRFDCVLVWKYDRFARSLGALIAALQEFRDLGVDFISHTQAIDTTTPMGRLFFHVIGSFAEFEREVIVERVRAGLANARAKASTLAGPTRPWCAGPRRGPQGRGAEPAPDRRPRAPFALRRAQDAEASRRRKRPRPSWPLPPRRPNPRRAGHRRYRLPAAALQPGPAELEAFTPMSRPKSPSRGSGRASPARAWRSWSCSKRSSTSDASSGLPTCRRRSSTHIAASAALGNTRPRARRL